MKRKAEEDHVLGLMPRFDPDVPWDSVLRMAANDRAYWDEFVREPALKFMASGSKRVGAPHRLPYRRGASGYRHQNRQAERQERKRPRGPVLG